MSQLINRPLELEKRRRLRRDSTPAEKMLWARLRAGQMGGKFRRQVSVGPFIVDFYCGDAKLALELDGPSHDGEAAEKYDRERQEAIEMRGITFLRFSNQQIYRQLDAVVETIACHLKHNA